MGKATPFGAQQAIIVRSESTAKSLDRRLRNTCTVLNLCDTKGLEFDGLILYNFFTESEAADSTWRALLKLVVRNDNDRVQYTIAKPKDFVSIDPVLCSELKQLYVAVTRARHRCWLWDSEEKIDLMCFWENWGLITVTKSLDTLCRFADFSRDLRQWARRGEEFFSNGLYALAVSCFERAGLDREAIIAEAYRHMSEAKILPLGSEESKNALIEAAEKMQACAKSSSHEHSSHSTATLWYHAATCLEGANEISRSAESYCSGGFYDQAVLVSLDAQDMETCLKVWLNHRKNIDASLARKIKIITSRHFLRERNYSDLLQLYDGNLEKCIERAHSLKLKTRAKDLLELKQQREGEELARRDPEPEPEPEPEPVVEMEETQNQSTPAKNAVLLMEKLWRKIQDKRYPTFDQEGQLYREYSQVFLQSGKKATENPSTCLTGRLVRGPGLSVILALRMLANAIDTHSERMDKLTGSTSFIFESPEVRACIQKKASKLRKYQEKLGLCLPLKGAPPLLKAKNPSSVKTHTAHAWDVFILVKNLEAIPKDQEFDAIEKLISRGRDVILESLKRLRTG